MLRATQLLAGECFEQAEQALASAQKVAAGDDEVTLAAIGRADVLCWRLADLGGAHRALDEASARVAGRPAADDLRVHRAILLLSAGRTARALVLCRGVLRRRRASVPALALGAALEQLARGLRGDVDRADSPDPRLRDVPAVFPSGMVALCAGLARVVNGLDVTVTDDFTCASSAVVHGIRLLWAGRPLTAGAVLEGAVAALAVGDRHRMLPIALGELAYARALLGDADGATAAAEEAERARHPLNRLDEFFVGRGGAWAAGARGEVSAARARVAATAERCLGLGQPVLAARAWYDLARLGDPAAAAAPLRRLVDAGTGGRRPGDPALVSLLAAHVHALATGDAALVAEAALAASRWGHRLHGAEAASQAAALHARRRRVDGDRWRELARELAGSCEQARTPPLARLLDVDLTPREQEVVGLAARGLSNPEIARVLDLSVRTVANHLQASYDKLGVHRRAELADLAAGSTAG